MSKVVALMSFSFEALITILGGILKIYTHIHTYYHENINLLANMFNICFPFLLELDEELSLYYYKYLRMSLKTKRKNPKKEKFMC